MMRRDWGGGRVGCAVVELIFVGFDCGLVRLMGFLVVGSWGCWVFGCLGWLLVCS